ncbi:MAG: SUMF1/EgtB/PvdO family nonheme iron enzyme, partial [Chloroflexota bacterium]
GDTGQVGNYPAGASQYGAMDMSGNVWEWVADYYKSDYYSVSDSTNPAGPAETSQKVRRGGAWSYIDNFNRIADRGNPSPDLQNDLGGFRCVK